jgi:hypothetical protein
VSARPVPDHNDAMTAKRQTTAFCLLTFIFVLHSRALAGNKAKSCRYNCIRSGLGSQVLVLSKCRCSHRLPNLPESTSTASEQLTAHHKQRTG